MFVLDNETESIEQLARRYADGGEIAPFVEAIAALPEGEYARSRKRIAKAANLGVTLLDRELGRLRDQKPPTYVTKDTGLFLVRGRNQPVRVSNFGARITGEVIEGGQRYFRIEASLNGQVARFSVLAKNFANMNWVPEHLGARAIVYPGQREHLRAAIQLLAIEDAS